MGKQDIQREVDHRTAEGHAPTTLKGISDRLAEIGYKLDRSLDCKSVARYITGERVGESYPCCTMYIRQKDNNISAFSIDARRDDNFRALQDLRMNSALYAVINDCIYEI